MMMMVIGMIGIKFFFFFFFWWLEKKNWGVFCFGVGFFFGGLEL